MKKLDELANPKSCMNRAHDNEMTFVLLGRDLMAPAVIREWCRLRCLHGNNSPKDPQITEALECAKKMEANREVAAPAPVDVRGVDVLCDISGRCCAPWYGRGTASCVHCGKELHERDGQWFTWDTEPGAGRAQDQAPAPPESPLISTLRYLLDQDLPKAKLLDRLVRAVRDANTTVDGRPLTAAEMRHEGECT